MHKDQAFSQTPVQVQGTLRSSFIAISASEHLKNKFRIYNSRPDVKNGSWAKCFEIHLLILHELLGTWRPYLRWLTLELARSVCNSLL